MADIVTAVNTFQKPLEQDMLAKQHDESVKKADAAKGQGVQQST